MKRKTEINCKSLG